MSYIKQFHFVLGLIISMLLASCAPVTPVTPTPLPTSTATVTLTPTVNPTQTPTLMPSPSPTPEVKVDIKESTSPDGLWIATLRETYFLMKSENNVEVLFTVRANISEAPEHTVEKYLATNVKPGGHLFPFIFQWSKDGRYMYYSHTEYGDGCFGFGNKDLVRYDLIAGETKEILDSRASEIAFSPDEKFLAYNKGWGSSLTIRNVGTLQDAIIKSPAKTIDNVEGSVTDIVWSNDGDYLAYTFVGFPCSFPLLTSIVLVDAQTLNQKVLIDIGDIDYHVKRFLDSNTLLLEGYQTGVPQKLFIYNISTGEIKPIG